MATQEKASQRIDLKATPAIKNLIDQGAAATHKSRSQFMLEAAIAAAQEAVMERRSFPLDDEDWESFNKLLKEQDPQDPRFQKLMGTPYVWD